MITNFGRSSRNLFRKEIAEANPKSSVALNDLAQTYEDAGDRQQAVALYKASVAINPFDSYAAECLRAIPRTTTHEAVPAFVGFFHGRGDLLGAGEHGYLASDGAEV